MIQFNQREQIIALTPQWKGERLIDGRPKVADKYLEKMRKMTLEELWKPIFLKGYESQFEGDLKTLHNDHRILIGRAVTCTFVPRAPICTKRCSPRAPRKAEKATTING